MAAGAELGSRLRDAVGELPKGLREHIYRVEAEADRLAERHDADRERAKLSALGHDLVRHLKGPELLAMASKYGLTPDAIEVASPILVHGPVAARILSLDYGVEDAELLDAVDCHTTARVGMTALEKVLFIADKIEPDKLKHRDELKPVFEAAQEGLDTGVLAYLDMYLADAVRRGWLLHPRVLEARNDVLRLLGRA